MFDISIKITTSVENLIYFIHHHQKWISSFGAHIGLSSIKMHTHTLSHLIEIMQTKFWNGKRDKKKNWKNSIGCDYFEHKR